MKFTKEEIAAYVTGWLGASETLHDVTAISSMLKNSLAMLEDDQDGIEACKERGAL